MIQAVLNKLFNKVDIKVNGTPGAPIYLRRWFIWPRRPQDDKLLPRRYLHRFYTGDNVRDLHDHPWPFDSIILWGGYWEHSFNPAFLKFKARYGVAPPEGTIPKTIKKWYGPGTFLKRGAAWTHAVELKKDKHGKDIPCWTIIKTGIKCRSWGFHTDNGWCWWRNYRSGACVCYDNPNEEIPGVSNGRSSSTVNVPQVAGGH